MKKQIFLISGITLSIVVGVFFYYVSVPEKTAAVGGVTTADNSFGGTNRCRYVDEAGGVNYSVCCSSQEYGPNCRTWCQQTTGGDFVTGGTCFVNGLTGTTTSSGAVYFNEMGITRFLQDGGTSDQINAINGIYTACQNLIASKPRTLPNAKSR